MDRKGSSGGIEARDGNPLKIPHYNNLSYYFEKCHDQNWFRFIMFYFVKIITLEFYSIISSKKKKIRILKF